MLFIYKGCYWTYDLEFAIEFKLESKIVQTGCRKAARVIQQLNCWEWRILLCCYQTKQKLKEASKGKTCAKEMFMDVKSPTDDTSG